LISVLFASYNGEDTLPLMLDAFLKIQHPAEDWEIIAVDNGSTDSTRAIICSYTERLPIKYYYQPLLGKSWALNLGIDYATGDLIVFTDDDIIPENNWLIQMSNCVNKNLDYSVFTGTIRPYWRVMPSSWILKNVPLNICYGKLDHEQGPCSREHIGGANFAVRRTVLESGIRFDVLMGPKGQQYAMGEDTSFIVALYEQGYVPYFCPSAIVNHIINEEQYEMSWILRRARRSGESACAKRILFNYPDGNKHVPLWMFRKLFSKLVLYAVYRIRANDDLSFRAAWESSYLYGYLSKYFSLRWVYKK
jgi:glycosyltransferase involved in cell wall biosynthesis